jgi:drug/metabolite transporter (DMT)-like permease
MSLMSRRARANALLAVAALLWGLAFTAQRVGAEHTGPFTFNAVRFALGGVLVGAAALGVGRWRRRQSPGLVRQRRPVALAGTVCGLVLTAAAGLQQAGMTDTTAGNAAFITGLYLVLVPLLGVFLGRRVRALALAGVALAVAGLYFMAVRETFTLVKGDGLVALSAFCFAAHILAVGHWAGRLPMLRFAAAQCLACAGSSAVLALVFEAEPFGGLTAAAIPLLYGGVLSVGVAYTLQVVGQRDAEPTPAALIMSAETVFGAIGGAVILGESMDGRGYLGAALMCAGIVLAQLPGATREGASPIPRDHAAR